MTRAFVVILLLVLTSYSIGHKVLTVPLSRQYIGNSQVAGNAAYSDLDPSVPQLIQDVKDVDEEYELHSPVAFVYKNLFYCHMRFAGGTEILLVLDLNTPWVSASLEGCQTCDAHKFLPKSGIHD